MLKWGHDTLYGGSGNDSIVGDFASMTINFHAYQAHAISGGYANSSAVSNGEVYVYGNDYIDGGSGNDTIWGDVKYVTTLLDGKTAIVDGGGTAIADLIFANFQYRYGHDVIKGGSGDDKIFGDQEYGIEEVKGGNAYANGGHASADAIYDGAKYVMGNDDIDGGSGNDTIYADSITFSLKVIGQGTAVAINGGTASAVASIKNTDVIMGNDIIRGESGNDIIFADTCKVTLPGNQLNSSVVNIDGVNYLRAFDSHNNGVIWGNDTIYGGSGKDTLVFNLFHTTNGKLGMQGFDKIFSFNKNQDVLSFGDVIDTNGNGQVNLSDLLGATTVQQQGGNTVVNFNGGGSLTFMGTQFNSLAELNVDVSANTVMA